MTTRVRGNRDGWDIPTGSGPFALMHLCPTVCDDDCETWCHESHQVRAKRHHNPDFCPWVFAFATTSNLSGTQ